MRVEMMPYNIVPGPSHQMRKNCLMQRRCYAPESSYVHREVFDLKDGNALGLVILPLSAPATRERPSTRTPVAPVWSVPTNDSLPYVPRSLSEIYQLMDPRQFEIFSAALVMCYAPGHRFLQHCGGSGDEGVDAKLLNQVGCVVAVQSKLSSQEHHVPHAELREFLGAITIQKAAYGYFVTTSSYTPAAD